jgi:hypothetical protein
MTDLVTAHARQRGVHARRHLTVYDGIDCTRFAAGGGAASARSSDPATAPVVGIVGHIQSWKGQDLVVQAMAQLRDRHPELRCLIVGGVHRRAPSTPSGCGSGSTPKARAARDPDGRASRRRGMPRCDGCRHPLVDESGAVRTRADRSNGARAAAHRSARGRPARDRRRRRNRRARVAARPPARSPPRSTGSSPTRRYATAMGEAGRARVDAVFDIRRHVATMEGIFSEMLAHPRNG